MKENEIVTFVKNKIYEDLSNEVEIKIKSKTQEYTCNSLDGSCFGTSKIPETYTYNLLITSKTNSNISIDGNYFTD